MSGWQALVREFYRKFALPIGTTPKLLTNDRMDTRIEWTDDEMFEMAQAQHNDDLPEVADAIVDAIYFLLGTAVEMGIELDPLFKAVHRANMEKEGGGTREDGKVLKPEGFTPPNISELLRKQGWTP